MTAQSSATTTEQKSRGGFNTPDLLARFLVNWAVRDPSDKVLDPASGDSIFLQEAIQRLRFLGADSEAVGQVNGVEIDEPTARQSRQRLTKLFGASPNIVNKGFFEVLPTLEAGSLDAYCGNPPFLRWANFFKSERELAMKFIEEQGIPSSKFMNSWVPFLVAGIYLLKPKGRLAMVMPAELLQVSYAANLREYLLNRFGFIFIVSFNRLVFPTVLQDVVLLMGTKGEGKGLRLVEVNDASDLEGVPRRAMPEIPIQNSKEKWTQYFLSDEQRLVMRKALENPSIKKLGQFCSRLDIGVVTGLNKYFILNREQAVNLDAESHLLPVLTRTANLHGATFSKSDWEEVAAKGNPAYLLWVKQLETHSDALLAYIKKGENEKVNEGYKASIRDPWYVVPLVWVPDAFLFRQIGPLPRMVLNGAQTTCTDTLHRVQFKNKKKGRTIVATFHNSLTLAFAEIFGRTYGGGVLELMPTEAERLPIPDIGEASNGLLGEVDKLLRDDLRKDAVALVDKRVLQEQLSFKESEIELFRTARNDLSMRRKTRREIA